MTAVLSLLLLTLLCGGCTAIGRVTVHTRHEAPIWLDPCYAPPAPKLTVYQLDLDRVYFRHE